MPVYIRPASCLPPSPPVLRESPEQAAAEGAGHRVARVQLEQLAGAGCADLVVARLRGEEISGIKAHPARGLVLIQVHRG